MMNAHELIERLRAEDGSDEEAIVEAALDEDPRLVDALLEWARRAMDGEVVPEKMDYYAFRVASDVVKDRAIKGRLRLAQAELMLVTESSDQYVLEAAIDAVGWNPDLDMAYALVFDKLRGSSDLDWTEAFEKVEGRGLPADALALLKHVIARGEAGAREGTQPYFISLAPKDGATLADVEALVAKGELVDAIAARRGATGDDFPTARRAIVRA